MTVRSIAGNILQNSSSSSPTSCTSSSNTVFFFEGGGQSFVALSVFSFQRVFTKIKIWQKYLLAGGQKFCSPDSQCTDSEECVEAGKDFVCHQVVVIMIIFSIVFIFSIFFINNDEYYDQASGQCKPSYGACFDTCDCLTNFGMVTTIILIVATFQTFYRRHLHCLR